MFFAQTKIQAIKKDASVKRSAGEVVLSIRFCCSQREAVSGAVFLLQFAARGITFIEFWLQCFEIVLQVASFETGAGLFAS